MKGAVPEFKKVSLTRIVAFENLKVYGSEDTSGVRREGVMKGLVPSMDNSFMNNSARSSYY